MKSLVCISCVFVIAILLAGCGHEQASQPPSGPVGGGGVSSPLANHRPVVPGHMYSLAGNNVGYGDMMDINYRNGLGTVICRLDIVPLYPPDDPNSGGPTPLGLAFDLDGTTYATWNVLSFDESIVWTQLIRVDPATGGITPIGDRHPFDTCGPDIDSHGTFYVCGMDVPHLGYIHGPGSLFSVDKATGEFTEIGWTVWNGPDVLVDPPVFHGERVTDWMDLAFDSRDQLYGTTRNKLFKISTTTGEITEVIPIRGVPGDPPPPPYTLIQEVMTIAFDDHDVLYGTAINVEWDTGHGAPFMRIDPATGQATPLGFTELPYNHGGDIMPTQVHVAHRTGNGDYHCINISMSALPAHLAHGDYVPGTVGHPECNCP